MKRNIIEMLDVHKKDGSTSMKTPDRPMPGVWDSEKVGGTPHKISPLVIIVIIRQFDVSQILNDKGGSCNIMYSELLEKWA